MIRFDGPYSRAAYAQRTSRLQTAKGVMFDFPVGRSEAIEAFLVFLKEYSGPKGSMVVFPQGITLNYFADIPSPIGQNDFTPPEIDSPGAEQRLVDRLKANPPDVVLIVSRDVREFGKEGFGIDYALLTTRWILDGYQIERQFSGQQPNGSQGWGLAMYVRKTTK